MHNGIKEHSARKSVARMLATWSGPKLKDPGPSCNRRHVRHSLPRSKEVKGGEGCVSLKRGEQSEFFSSPLHKSELWKSMYGWQRLQVPSPSLFICLISCTCGIYNVLPSDFHSPTRIFVFCVNCDGDLLDLASVYFCSWMSEWRPVDCSLTTVIYSWIRDTIYMSYLDNVAFKSKSKKAVTKTRWMLVQRCLNNCLDARPARIQILSHALRCFPVQRRSTEVKQIKQS